MSFTLITFVKHNLVFSLLFVADLSWFHRSDVLLYRWWPVATIFGMKMMLKIMFRIFQMFQWGGIRRKIIIHDAYNVFKFRKFRFYFALMYTVHTAQLTTPVCEYRYYCKPVWEIYKHKVSVLWSMAIVKEKKSEHLCFLPFQWKFTQN